MNRRVLLKTVLAGMASVGVVNLPAPSVPKIGFLDVDGHRAHKNTTGEDLHVFLDGVDVTSNCYEASDVDGFVRVFCSDPVHHKDWTAKGARHVDKGTGGACRLELHGAVEFRAIT